MQIMPSLLGPLLCKQSSGGMEMQIARVLVGLLEFEVLDVLSL